MTDVSTALSTTPSWPVEAESGDGHATGAPNSSPTLESVAAVLDRLEAAGWRALLNRLSPGSLYVIDYVAVGPGGIFVIDTHSFARSAVGVSVISDPDQPAKISAAQTVADAVRSLLPPLTRQYVVSVLAYADTSPMSLSRGPIQICTTAMLERVIAARHDVLSDSEIADIVASLDAALQPAGNGPHPAAIAETTPTALTDAPASPESDSASTKHAETRRGRRFLGRRVDKAAAAAAHEPKTSAVVPPVSANAGPTEPPSPYPFVSPPVAAVHATTADEADAAIDEPETLPVAEAAVESVEPETPSFAMSDPPSFAAIEAEPEVVDSDTLWFSAIEAEPVAAEPEIVEPETQSFAAIEAEPVPAEPVAAEPEVVDSDTQWFSAIDAEPVPAEPVAAEPEVVDSDTQWFSAIDAEPVPAEPQIVEPDTQSFAAIEAEPEPEVIEASTSHRATPSYDDMPLTDYFRDLHSAERAASDPADLEVEAPIREPEALASESIETEAVASESVERTVGSHVAEAQVERDSLGYAADLGYDADPDAKVSLTAKPDEPAWEELSITDLHAGVTSDTDVPASQPAAAASLDTASPDAEASSTPQTEHGSGGRRKAPAKPWHHLVSTKVASAAPRRARQLTSIEESEEPERLVEYQPASPTEAPTVKAFSFVDPTTAAEAPESAEPILDASAQLPSVDAEIGMDHDAGPPAAIASVDIEGAEPSEPQPVGWSIDHQTDVAWTPAPAVAPRAEAPSFTSTSAASAWDTGLTVAVSRWKTSRFGQSPKSSTMPPADAELDDASESAGAPASRKQSVAAAPTASMPAGLSRRGQKMYAAMNGGDAASDVTSEAEESKPRRRTVRKLFVFAVIAGLLVLSSLHYTDISTWVSDHVDLPGMGESQDGPHKGGKNDPVKDKSNTDADKNDAAGGSAGNG